MILNDCIFAFQNQRKMRAEKCMINISIIVSSLIIIILSSHKPIAFKHLASSSTISNYIENIQIHTRPSPKDIDSKSHWIKDQVDFDKYINNSISITIPDHLRCKLNDVFFATNSHMLFVNHRLISLRL